MSFSFPSPILARDLKVALLEADTLAELALAIQEWGLERTEGDEPNQRLILAMHYDLPEAGGASVFIHYVE